MAMAALIYAALALRQPPSPRALRVASAAATSASNAVAVASKAVQRSPRLAAGSFAAGVAVGFATSSLRNAMELYLTADDIPGGTLRSHRSLVGRVVAVNDGDTFRLRHLPSPLSSGRYEGKLSENTIALRIAAVDAPETAKFGKPGMPLGEEAKEFTRQCLLNRRVKVRCYARDQYGRIVGTVRYGPWRRDLSTQLLRRGLASVYRQAGAVYGERALEKWDALEAAAQKQRLGIWSQGVDKAVLPSEFKAKQKKQ